MEVTLKIRFNASKESFESYGGNRYLLYLPFPEDEDSINIIIGLVSRKVGVPVNRVEFKNKDFGGNWVFKLN